jgi:hypothetical protein
VGNLASFQLRWITVTKRQRYQYSNQISQIYPKSSFYFYIFDQIQLTRFKWSNQIPMRHSHRSKLDCLHLTKLNYFTSFHHFNLGQICRHVQENLQRLFALPALNHYLNQVLAHQLDLGT